jgi:hypothetical protein
MTMVRFVSVDAGNAGRIKVAAPEPWRTPALWLTTKDSLEIERQLFCMAVVAIHWIRASAHLSQIAPLALVTNGFGSMSFRIVVR